MANPARKKLLEQYHSRYRILNAERGPFYNLCIYCGLPATCRDHVPPLSRVSDYESLGLKREMYLLVPSCTQCNHLLGNSLQDTLIDRVEYLKDKLSRRFVKKLQAQDWDDDELLELGPTLRSYVAVETAKDIAVKKRIEYYLGIDSVMDEL